MHIFEISSRKRKIPFDLLIFSVQEKQKKQRWKKKHPTAPQPARDAKSIPQKRHTHTIITKKHAWRNLRRLLQFNMEIIWDSQTTGAKFLSKYVFSKITWLKKKIEKRTEEKGKENAMKLDERLEVHFLLVSTTWPLLASLPYRWLHILCGIHILCALAAH